jgi:hypothetical protein
LGQTLAGVPPTSRHAYFHTSLFPSTLSTRLREQKEADVLVQNDILNVNEAAACMAVKPWTLRHWIPIGRSTS